MNFLKYLLKQYNVILVLKGIGLFILLGIAAWVGITLVFMVGIGLTILMNMIFSTPLTGGMVLMTLFSTLGVIWFFIWIWEEYQEYKKSLIV